MLQSTSSLRLTSLRTATVRVSALSIFVCPSDRNTGLFSVTSQLTSGRIDARTTSYAANQGTGDSSQGNGMFRMNKSVRPKDVEDGLSNTISLGERGSFVVQNAWAGAPRRRPRRHRSPGGGFPEWTGSPESLLHRIFAAHTSDRPIF